MPAPAQSHDVPAVSGSNNGVPLAGNDRVATAAQGHGVVAVAQPDHVAAVAGGHCAVAVAKHHLRVAVSEPDDLIAGAEADVNRCTGPVVGGGRVVSAPPRDLILSGTKHDPGVAAAQ